MTFGWEVVIIRGLYGIYKYDKNEQRASLGVCPEAGRFSFYE